jgi:hypothetical protein
MTAATRQALRWTALVALWALVAAVLWLTAVQTFLVALNPFCQLQRPRVAYLTVTSVDSNPDSQITDFVSVKDGDQTRVLYLSKTEAASLHAEDQVWILEAWYADNLRPTQFRLTLLRVLLEYPWLLLLPAGFGLWSVRRAQAKAEAEPPPPVRRTFTDDFHLRAQRFAKTEAATEVEPEREKRDQPPMDTDEHR